MNATEIQHLPSCDHCSEPCFEHYRDEENNLNFCCNGCKTVHHILSRNELLNFYDIASDEKIGPKKVVGTNDSFLHLDTAEFYKDYVTTDHSHSVRFYLDNIHCLACLWLIERTPHFIYGLINVRLDITNSIATIVFNKQTKLSVIASQFSRLGYYPHPIKSESEKDEIIKKSERKEFLRIGIAGAAMMNIMIYAISNYAGADGGYRIVFDWISFAFAVPVVLFSAVPFYRSSIQALRQKIVNIDLPLSIAIIFGFLLSTYAIVSGIGEQYFDTIASLVFLILLSRYFVRYATQKGLDIKGLNTFFTNTGVKKITPNGIESLHSDYINVKDKVMFEEGETIIFDGFVEQDSAIVDSSIISGESKPQFLQKNELVFAGSKNLNGQLILKVTKLSTDTRIGKIIQKVQSASHQRPEVVYKADKFAQRFIYFILGLTTIASVFYAYTTDINTAINISLAIIIVSCPCALALATPLAYIKSLNLLKSKGIFLKSEQTLERLTKIRTIVLDKTGTITKGSFKVLEFKIIESQMSREEVLSIVKTLESKSIHPIAITLKKFATTANDFKAIKLNEIHGKGVEAYIDGNHYFIGKPKDFIESAHNYTQVALYKNHELTAFFSLGDELKEDSERATKDLLNNNIDLIIASGDQESIAKSIGQKVGIKKDNVYGNLSPEDKANLLSQYENVAMVGDGANDALAMKQSSLGIAVAGAMDISLRASDVFLTKPSLLEINHLLKISKETERIVKRNFALSLSYNIFGVSLAVLGFVTPLFAAILMPISSLTILFSTVIGTKDLRTITAEVIK